MSSGWKIAMAGPRSRTCLSLLCLSLMTAAGCAGAPSARKPPEKVAAKPAEKPPEKPAEKPAPRPEPAPAPVRNPNEEILSQPSSKEVDVVDPGGERGPVTLVEAARAERERRSRSGPPVAVINDKNVNHSKGQLTIADPKKTAPSAADAAALKTLKDEKYWRDRALDIRTRLSKATDRFDELELAATGWRRRFYSEEDPYFRDSKIKPEWDRVLNQLEETRTEIDSTRKELDSFLEEGREAGALPGWLREGGELIPVEMEPDDSPGTVDPEEPQIYEEKPPA
jgi:hypothetical protein